MCEQQLQTTETEEIEAPEPTLPNCDLPLHDRSLQTEEALRDLGCHEVEISVAAARQILTEDPSIENAMALTGALAVADAVIDQLSAHVAPQAIDGDIHFRHTSFAPGRKLRLFIQQLLEAEKQAMDQRGDLLRPLLEAIRGAEIGGN